MDFTCNTCLVGVMCEGRKFLNMISQYTNKSDISVIGDIFKNEIVIFNLFISKGGCYEILNNEYIEEI